jgi:acetyl-CoA acetyltransferase
MSARQSYRIKDQLAFASVATTEFSRTRNDRTQLSMTIDACVDAVRAAGLTAADIDGISGSGTSHDAKVLQSALGIPRLSWWAQPPLTGTFATTIFEAMHAIQAGVCETVLCYHAAYRLPWQSRAAALDPMRRRVGELTGMMGAVEPETMSGSVGYTAWASRYLHQYGRKREDFGLIAINSRSNAMRNEHAVMRDPLSMDDFLKGRMIRDPLSVYDMDVAVDGADAFIVTTAERARDLKLKPVLIHAHASGMVGSNEEDQLPGLHAHGQQIVIDLMNQRSDVGVNDADLYYPYDGFTLLAISWIENSGLCKSGEGGDFLRANWDASGRRALLRGRVPLNSHGGSLCDGATQGSGHIREAILQLQGRAGSHQVQDAKTALLHIGGFFYNSHALALHTA